MPVCTYALKRPVGFSLPGRGDLQITRSQQAEEARLFHLPHGIDRTGDQSAAGTLQLFRRFDSRDSV